MIPTWIRNIQVGDVLKSGSGRLRIVRRVSPGTLPTHFIVAFLIQRCSWTHRCYTIYNAADLKTLHYTPTGRRLKLKTDFDLIVAEEFELSRKAKSPVLTCCDVIGIP